MKLFTLSQLEEAANTYINQQYIANPTYTPTINDYTGLVNKIIAEVVMDGDYSEDLGFMDGFNIPVGSTIEEYYANFIAPTDLDPDGSDNDAPADLSFAPATYSTALGEKVLKVSERYSQVQKGFFSEADYRSLVTLTMKRLYDSLELYLNACKREFIGKVATKLTGVSSLSAFSTSTKYAIGDHFKNGVAVKSINANQYSSLAAAIADNAVVTLDLSTELAKPVDETTGEAFIISVKERAEKFSRPRQGCSYNGNIAGRAPQYVLLVKEGVFPNLEVKTMAGAFHLDKLGFDNVRVLKVKDFGSNTSAYAMMVDERAIKIHLVKRYVLDHINADGGFINHVIHDEEICHYSVNTMAYVWNDAE